MMMVQAVVLMVSRLKTELIRTLVLSLRSPTSCADWHLKRSKSRPQVAQSPWKTDESKQNSAKPFKHKKAQRIAQANKSHWCESMQNLIAQQPEDYVKSAMKVIAANVQAIADEIDYSEVKTLFTGILAAQQNHKRLFVMGAGRSGLVVKGFAMRLMHVGFNVYVVGETVTPAVETDDLLIVISGSGETKSINEMSALAKAKGTRLAAVTSNRDSTLGTISDAIVVVKGRTKASGMDFMERQVVGSHISFAPLGTMFEISTMVFLDGIIAALMEITKKSEEDLKKKHATLE